MDYLEIQSTSHPEEFGSLLDLFAKKLWHQLGLKLAAIAKLPFFQSGEQLLQLHDGAIKSVSDQLNQQQYVWFALAAATQQKDKEASIKFIEEVAEAVKEDAQACLLCKADLARYKIQTNQLAESKALLEEALKLMAVYSGITDAAIQSHLYLASMEYYKTKGPAAEYYKNSLMYLTYTELTSIPVAEQVALAADVGLAAILGDGIYNFGELMQHPVVTKLHDTPQQWISELLVAFNRGDILAFKTIYAKQASSQAALQAAEGFLHQKIRIMALIDLVFSKDAHSRTISFEEIASTCDCKLDQVELHVMKAFSLGVLKGLMDQVESEVRIKWVQPRVLDTKQVGLIRDRLQEWSTQVANSAKYLEANAPELLLAAQ